MIKTQESNGSTIYAMLPHVHRVKKAKSDQNGRKQWIYYLESWRFAVPKHITLHKVLSASSANT